MNTKWIINPYYCYILSFGIVFFIYSWGWSEIYPTLTTDVFIFLVATFIITFFVGRRVQPIINYRFILVSKKNTLVSSLILCSYFVEFIYNGGIPLILLLKGTDIAYMDFGIPTFHVILHTFSCFYAVYLYHQYISSKDKKALILFLLLLCPNVLIVNRGAVIMILTSCLVMYLVSIKKVLLKRIISIFLISILFFYAFGYLGNSRSFNGDATAFPRITKATESFMDGFVPNEYYWFYIYASSPFANFQNAAIESKQHRYDYVTFVSWEILPDFISKRIVSIEDDYDGKNRLDYSINPILTVGSMYFEPYIRLGWFGPIIVFAYYILFSYLYIIAFPKNSRYYNSAMAILCTISIFSIFENMLNFSGLIFQLVFPLLLSRLSNYKFILPKMKRVRLVLLKKITLRV